MLYPLSYEGVRRWEPGSVGPIVPLTESQL